jgi:hypothetical protein
MMRSLGGAASPTGQVNFRVTKARFSSHVGGVVLVLSTVLVILVSGTALIAHW